MRLNAGCGLSKLEGYLNIDIDASLKPDYVMPLWDLDFDDEKFNEVLSKQSIEHLGFFKTKYFLSESFRILKHHKLLIVETVDIEESFNLFIRSNLRDERERILNWIFGSETKNMNHLYCFPCDLIMDLLAEAGFEVIGIEKFMYERLRPAIRVKSIKVKKDLKEAKLRKILVKHGIIDTYDEIIYSEIERVIKSIRWGDVDEKYLFEISFVSPVLSYALSSILNVGDRDVFRNLIEKGFTGYLYERFRYYLDMYHSFDSAYRRLKSDFFDNPRAFIYNFIEDSSGVSSQVFALTETILRYLISKEKL